MPIQLYFILLHQIVTYSTKLQLNSNLYACLLYEDIMPYHRTYNDNKATTGVLGGFTRTVDFNHILLSSLSSNEIQKYVQVLVKFNKVYLNHENIVLSMNKQLNKVPIFTHYFNTYTPPTYLLKYTNMHENIILSSREQVMHSSYNIHLNEEEMCLMYQLVENSVSLRYVIFLLKHFQEINESVFLMFSPKNGGMLSFEEAKQIILKHIVNYLYMNLFEEYY